MDTIIYFYKKRGLEAPEVEPVGLKTYLLIRVRLDVGREEWFGKKLKEASSSTGSGHLVEESRIAEASSPARSGYPVGESLIAEADCPAGSGHPAEKSLNAEAGSPAGYGYPVGKSRIAEAGGHKEEIRAGNGHTWKLLHPLRALRQRKKARQEARREQEAQALREQERKRRLAARARMLEEVEAAICRLAAEVEELAGDRADCYYVYEDSIRRALVGEAAPSGARRPDSFSEKAAPSEGRRLGSSEKAAPSEGRRLGSSSEKAAPPGARRLGSSSEKALLPQLWERHFQGKTFRGYAERFWVEQLLHQAVQAHFVILGTAPCLFDVIEALARRMKSLRWILPEADCSEELLGFVEDFCTEYGLAIMLEPFESAAALKRLRLVCGQPVNVLDFTGEAYMAVSDVPKGSVWLDMFSVEAKRRRIDARGTGIAYVSLKEKWKTVQKRCTCPIVP